MNIDILRKEWFDQYHNQKRKLKRAKRYVKKNKQDLGDLSKIKGKKYQVFIKSKYWTIVRNMVLIRDNYVCCKCGSPRELHVHHLTYKHHFAEHKHLDDLITLCRYCHEKEHQV